MVTTLKCNHCHSLMRKTTKAERDMVLQLLAVLLFLGGAIMLFVVPVGTVFGIILMLTSLFLGYKKIKVWKCPNCGHFFERA